MKLTKKRKTQVLRKLVEKPVLAYAARELGLDALELNQAIQGDEEFAGLVAEAEAVGIQNAEEEAWRRGVSGLESIVYKAGVPVMVVDPETGESTILKENKYSDKLLELILKSRDDRYGDRQKIEVSGQQVLVVPEVSNLEQFREMLIEHKENET